MKTYFFLIFLILILISFDRYNYINYTVENKTGDSIQLIYSYGDNYFDNQATDTSIILKGNQKDTLFIFTQISPSVYDPEDGDKMIYIRNMDITRMRDSMKIKKDAAVRENWNFSETGRNAALMEFIFSDGDF